MELLKFTTKVFAIGCLLAMFAGCDTGREEDMNGDMQDGQMQDGGGMQNGDDMGTPDQGQQPGQDGMDMMGCCQKADNTCSGPVSEQQCTGMGGQFQQGASCGTDGMCTQDQMQPQQQ